MTSLAKTGKGMRKKPTVGDVLVTPKTLVFAHKFASDSASLDLSNLIAPTDPQFSGWINPTSAEISKAHLINKKAKLYLQYVGRPARLLPTVSYDVSGDMSITLKNGAEAVAGDIIMGWIDTYSGNAKAIDAYTIVKTGVLTAGQTDITTNLPFTYNKYSDQQVGDVILFTEGQQIFRCQGNSSLNDGEYTEVAPSSGKLTNTLRLKEAVTEDTSYLVVSNGMVAFAPTDVWMDYVRTLAGQIDVLVADMAGVTGNPTTRYQTAPNETDLSVFGQRVYAFNSETFYNCVVGSSLQVAQGKATHTGVQQAHNDCPTGGKVLLLEGTYTGNVVWNKKIGLEGKGNSSVIDGTVTIGVSYISMKNLKFGNNLTIAVGANGNFIRECWIASGKTVTDSGSANSWSSHIIEEA